MADIPKPTDTGSAGIQVPGIENTLVAEVLRPFEGLPIYQRLEGLAAVKPRIMGGELAANLVAGSFTQMANDLNQIRRDLQDTRRELQLSQNALAECREKSAVLNEKVKANSKDRHLRNVCVAFGPILIAIAIELVRHDLEKVGYILSGMGVLLLIFGWFYAPKGTEK